MNFETNTVDLSLLNVRTGRPLTANVYDVTFDDGSLRTMSMGQLVMAICLERATEMEGDILEIMETMAGTTANIDALASIEERILEASAEKDEISLYTMTGEWAVTHVDDYTGQTVVTVAKTAAQALDLLEVTYSNSAESTISSMESKMDQLNTTSQEQMIVLQSQTNKRDQSYEMISNVLKSIYTVMNGVVNNV